MSVTNNYDIELLGKLKRISHQDKLGFNNVHQIIWSIEEHLFVTSGFNPPVEEGPIQWMRKVDALTTQATTAGLRLKLY